MEGSRWERKAKEGRKERVGAAPAASPHTQNPSCRRSWQLKWRLLEWRGYQVPETNTKVIQMYSSCSVYSNCLPCWWNAWHTGSNRLHTCADRLRLSVLGNGCCRVVVQNTHENHLHAEYEKTTQHLTLLSKDFMHKVTTKAGHKSFYKFRKYIMY